MLVFVEAYVVMSSVLSPGTWAEFMGEAYAVAMWLE